jgi:ribosomal protein S8
MEFWKNKKVQTIKGQLKYLKDFTQEELIYEKVKCATDSIYVIENYFYIFDQTKNNNNGEIVPFILFPFQRNLIKSYETNRFNITNKYRQAGVSTVTCAWLATYIAFNQNRSVAIVANKLETARDELMKDVTNFIDMLPPFLHPKISDKDAANHKIYMNGSQVKAFATNSLRGYTPTFLFWDEAAWCDNGESFWTGTLPTLSTGGNAALVSCVTADTMVWTNKGLNTIGEIVDKDKEGGYIVDNYSVLGKDRSRNGSIMFNNGHTDTRIITNEFTEIECSLNHKLWTYLDFNGSVGYRKAGDISKNCYVGIQYGLGVFGNIDEIKYVPLHYGLRGLYKNFKHFKYKYFNYKINKNYLDVIAIFLQKGFIRKSDYIHVNKKYLKTKVVFDNLSKEQIDIIKQFYLSGINYINYHEDEMNYVKVDEENNIIISTSQSINNIINNTGLYYNKSYDTITNRTLPKIIKMFKKEHLVYLVKRWVYHYEDKMINNESIIINHKSLILLKEFQQILINYGILSKIEQYVNNGLNHSLTILCEYDKFIADEDYFPEYNQHLPIGLVFKLNEIIGKYNIELPFNQYNRIYILNLIKSIDDIISKEDKDEINKYISPNIYWSKVINIKSNKNNTYDFSLNKNKNDFWAHSVIYNGILGHQTPNGLDPVFYKTYNNAKNGTSEFKANELYWYYDPRYSKDLIWKKKDDLGNELIVKEINKDNFRKLLEDGYKPSSPWYDAMASKFNYDKKKIAQELECVTGDTIITVKNNETGEIENIKIEDLYKIISDNKYTVLNHKNEFVNFDGIYKKLTCETIKIYTNNHQIETSKTHKLIKNNNKVFVNDLVIGDSILTKNGYENVIKIEYFNEEKYVYDLVNVGINSLYLTNGIVSHNCSFLGSGNNFIDEENIKRIEDTQIKDPIRMEYDDFFWIWEDPIRDKSYVMTVDVSTGAGDDYSTIIIMKRHETHLEEVAEFKHKVSPDTLGVIANDYGLRYNNAYAIVDITGGIGAMTAKTMLELGYNNMHYTVSRHEPTKEKLTDYVKEDENGKTLVPGFVISTSNRGMILTEMKRAIEANEVDIKSYRLISEFKTFITTTNNRVADHRRSFNDDLVIALAMGIYVFSYDIRSVGMSVERTKKMLEAITNNTTDNNTGNSVSSNGSYAINPSNPYVAHGWLFKGLNK